MTVVLQSEVIRDARCHRNGTHTSITDQRIQLLTFRQEEIHDLHEADTRGGGDHKGHGSEGEYLDGIQCQKLAGLGRTTYGETQEHHYDIVEGCTCSLCQAGGLAALFEQVAEEQHTEQG